MQLGRISLPPDGKYRGPGGPDPKKTRPEREAELRAMIATDGGSDIIVALAHEAMGVPLGTSLPIGMLLSQMIERILDHEYPPGMQVDNRHAVGKASNNQTATGRATNNIEVRGRGPNT